MTDIVAELRRLYEAAPQGEWDYDGPFDDGDKAGWIETRDERGDSWPVVGIGIDRPEVIDLIVAMHNHLPQLLRMVESLRLYVRHMEQDNPDDPDQWIYLMGQRWYAIEAALAKLKQDGDA